MRRRMQHLWFTRRWALLFISVLLGVAISCSEGVVTSEGARAALPSHVKAVADGNRPMPGTVSPEVLMSQFAELLYEYGDFSDEAPATLVRYDPDPIGVVDAPVAQISIGQAIEETRLLFAVLKYGYAGYRIFGGDEAFGAARESILSRIGRDTGFIATEELLELIESPRILVTSVVSERRHMLFQNCRNSLRLLVPIQTCVILYRGG